MSPFSAGPWEAIDEEWKEVYSFSVFARGKRRLKEYSQSKLDRTGRFCRAYDSEVRVSKCVARNVEIREIQNVKERAAYFGSEILAHGENFWRH